MNNITYCIFEVFDYKGGELSSRINLDKKEFISELSSNFENLEYNEPLEIKDIKLKISEYLDSNEFYSEYAGSGSFVGEIYKIENNQMIKISFEEHIDEISEYIINNWE